MRTAFRAFGHRFAWTLEAGLGLTEVGRDYSVGWRLLRRHGSGGVGSLELSFEARQLERTNANGRPEREEGLWTTGGAARGPSTVVFEHRTRSVF